MTTTDKSVILPTFDGKDDAFQAWWTRFRAFATAKGVVEALLGREAELPNSEGVALDPATQDAAIEAKGRDSLAMACLSSAFKAQADVSLACETVDDDWPGGLACKVAEKLLEVCKPSRT